MAEPEPKPRVAARPRRWWPGGWVASEGSAEAVRPQDWHRRHLVVGLGLGAGLGVINQVLVSVLGSGELEASIGQRVAAVAYSTLVWVVIAFALAALGSLLFRLRHGPRLALLLSAGGLGSLAFVSAVGTALRVISGSYLTAGAVLFSLGSLDHFIHAAMVGYVGWFAIIVAALLACGTLTYQLLRGAVPREPPRATPNDLAVAAALTLVVGVVYVQRAHYRFTKRMFVSSPLLSLVSSMDTSFDLDRTNQRGPIGEKLAPDGPPLRSEDAWDKTLATASGPRPNVLLIILESLALSHTSLVDYERDTTPTLRRLADEGLSMRRAWTTATHSNYAQMAILSSLFPRRVHGLDQYERIDYPRVLFHDTFHRLGYDTATITSQDENWQGMRRFQDTGTPTFFWFSETFEGPHLDSGVEKIVPDAATTDVVLDWLDRDRTTPWALYVNLQATHFPYTLAEGVEHPYLPDEPDPATFGYLGYPRPEREIVINRYDNALRYVDDQLARLVDHLEASGQLDDTLIAITADHGEMFFEKDLVTHGKTLYEIEARVPLILHWPGHVPVGERDEPVSNLDLLPTIADALDLPPHPSWQGASFLTPQSRAVYMNIQGLRFADGIVCWPWKLILERTGQTAHLFRLDVDPDEDHNLIDQQPEIAARLDDTLRKQLLAQLDYHREDAPEVRHERFQPRLRPCPDLAGAEQAPQ